MIDPFNEVFQNRLNIRKVDCIHDTLEIWVYQEAQRTIRFFNNKQNNVLDGWQPAIF